MIDGPKILPGTGRGIASRRLVVEGSLGTRYAGGGPPPTLLRNGPPLRAGEDLAAPDQNRHCP